MCIRDRPSGFVFVPNYGGRRSGGHCQHSPGNKEITFENTCHRIIVLKKSIGKKLLDFTNGAGRESRMFNKWLKYL